MPGAREAREGAERAGFRDAIEAAERMIGRVEPEAPPPAPPERPPLDETAFRGAVAAAVEAVLAAGKIRPTRAMRRAISHIRADTIDAPDWRFTMLSASENRRIVQGLQGVERPAKAMLAWGIMLDEMDWQTGEVRLSRKALAEAVGCTEQAMTNITAHLEQLGAIRRVKVGREVRYRVESDVATHLTGADRAAAHAEAQERKRELARAHLRPIDGGRSDAG